MKSRSNYKNLATIHFKSIRIDMDLPRETNLEEKWEQNFAPMFPNFFRYLYGHVGCEDNFTVVSDAMKETIYCRTY